MRGPTTTFDTQSTAMTTSLTNLPDPGYMEGLFAAVERHPMAASLVLLAMIAGWAIHKGMK